ncbi:hypothetical protein DNJ95_05185 [Stutzerimonas kirkiae]|uniref:Sarcosine oxidase subunit gamma n=1 Tax=Stutzerimonas kirkiae TaxID=2211392 RepID=A0A4Q9RAV4_9GAMM|nr:hypothetical protein [Stutzerimonas kirkiae]TBU97880.1 hypothetical protein DNJ96_07085 [Stutzerimonas kirkiae]TBV04604.1 hypothetical protein DNJ95_05185 [Stutzerimonas kirkiae]TBV16058.1 hypothetical protein DNK01_03560 [Stutzerimonas kirkiae]
MSDIHLQDIHGRPLWLLDQGRDAAPPEGFPLAPNSCRLSADGLRIAWLAPGRWLLDGPQAAAYPAPPGCTTQDLSDHWRLIRIGGRHWRGLLSRTCPLDLHTCFPPDRESVAGTLLLQVPVRILVAAAGEHAELLVPRSYHAWLRQALEVHCAALGD